VECDAKEGGETDSVLPAGKLLLECNSCTVPATLTAVSNTRSVFDVVISVCRIITYAADERSR